MPARPANDPPTGALPHERRLAAARRQRHMVNAMKHGFLVLMLVFAFYPFVFMVMSSLKTTEAVTQNFWFPPTRSGEVDAQRNYFYAWSVISPFVRNSILVTGANVIGVLVVATMSAYVFARYRFPGHRILFMLIIALLMVPGVLSLIPSFMWVRALFGQENWNLIDTYWVLILPTVAGAQVGAIFLCRGFFASLPNELFEAARIDGASNRQIILQIVLPLSKPILGTVAVMNILASWNNFMWPLLTVGDKQLYTIAVGLRYFQGQYATDYGPLFAGYVIASIPLIVLFLLTMRYFIAGLTTGAIKA